MKTEAASLACGVAAVLLMSVPVRGQHEPAKPAGVVAAEHAPAAKTPAHPTSATQAASEEKSGDGKKAATPKNAEAKTAEAKMAETKAPEGRSAVRPSLATAVERIHQRMAEITQDSHAGRPASPTARTGAPVAPPRIRLEWRTPLTWPTELTAADSAASAPDTGRIALTWR